MRLLLHGDVYSSLNELEDCSISVAITSPPYWKQRDYGFDEQIGQESTPEEYMGRLVRIFNLLRRKLREDGVFFLNVGDKYLQRYGKSHLLQIPYRLAYHMVEDGWVLEDVIIWYKPNHMPSPVRDRFTNTYEPIFVFSKGERNIYMGGAPIIKIRLQRTPWKHTAVFPERLVESLLRRVRLTGGDLVLDPFAGTGTVGAVAGRMNLDFVLIERCDDFVRIMRERIPFLDVREVSTLTYRWEPVRNPDIPRRDPDEILSDRRGEVVIVENSSRFLSVLAGMITENFRRFHREDALYFVGVMNWSLMDLCVPALMIERGYVLRNMVVVSRGDGWFPVFMMARDSTRVAYRFNLDRVRVRHRSQCSSSWFDLNFVGMTVRDISGKRTRRGVVVRVLERYDDGFPMVLAVRWNDGISAELALHPEMDEEIREGLKFRCPRCSCFLDLTGDPEERCPSCGRRVWEGLPVPEEPKIVEKLYRKVVQLSDRVDQVGSCGCPPRIDKRESRSKFIGMRRENWGASPGARKQVLGEYFTKMRLYRIEQPLVARYLNGLRRRRGMSVKDVERALPEGYRYTVGHWFRRDFGGSTPIPQDVGLLRNVLGDDTLLRALERTALKFQTVKPHARGKNPGDFIEGMNPDELVSFFRKLFL